MSLRTQQFTFPLLFYYYKLTLRGPRMPVPSPPAPSLIATPAPSPITTPAPSLILAPVTPPRDILQDVEVPLTLIRPSAVPPTLVYDSAAVRVNLYRTENKPEPSVVVFLLTVTNSSTAPIDVSTLEV